MAFGGFDLSYFYNKIPSILENEDIRQPQKNAYSETYDHFITKSQTADAIILLPPGVGKTGLMGLLPFYVSKGRVLVITPQLTIKDGVLSELDPDNSENFWLKRNVFTNSNDLPSVIEYETNTPREVLEAANIVVLNIHKLQVRLDSALINIVPHDFFDMIIIDEAHHSVANTWVDTCDHFTDAKVIKLTGTPIRPDGRGIYGEIVYRYKLSQAMANNYVKSLRKFDYVPDDCCFTTAGSEELLPYDKVKDLKDEDWISSSVALSEDCSLKVVKESIRLLKRKTSDSNIPHKIIAVACNIEHAELIKHLYTSEGCHSTIVHSKMTKDEIKNAKLDIKYHRVQVVVEVAMLGEGYDHKYLSIAAIFRPFKSLLAYEQFVGRILRYIPEGEKAADNIGDVVVHKYLHLEELWLHYKKEIETSEVIKSLSDMEIYYDDSYESDNSSTRELTDYGTVTESETARVETDTYLTTELIKRQKEEDAENEEKIKKVMDALAIQRAEAERIVQSSSVKNNPIKRPDLYFRSRKNNIDIRIKEQIVPELLIDFDIDKDGDELSAFEIFKKEYSWIPVRNGKNGGMLATYFNTYLKKIIGISRDKWTVNDYDIAEEKLSKCVESVRLKLQEFRLR